MLDRAHLAIVARDAIEDIARVTVILFREEQGKRNDYQFQKYFTRQAFATPGDIVEFGVLPIARKAMQVLNDLCIFFQDPRQIIKRLPTQALRDVFSRLLHMVPRLT